MSWADAILVIVFIAVGAFCGIVAIGAAIAVVKMMGVA